jgi:hypothetical protein
MWFAMTILGLIATGAIESESMKAGNPARLLNPIDYKGRICGYDNGVKNKEYGYYMPDTSGKMRIQVLHAHVNTVIMFIVCVVFSCVCV